MTGKVFEYIGSGRPIFALAPDGPLKDLIEDGEFGFVAQPNNSEEISRVFKKIYQDWKKNKKISYYPQEKVKEMYTRKNLTIQLADVFKEVSE